MKRPWMLVVLLRGVNHGSFGLTWGVQDETSLYLDVKVSFRAALKEMIKNNVVSRASRLV